MLLVTWKAPSTSLIGTHAACGGLFRDHLGSLLGAFACNIGLSTVFNVEVYAFLLALEYAAHNGWRNVWLQSDSPSALMVFKNLSLVLVLLRNHWHNACNQGIQIITSHIFREGNCCANLLTNMGHSTHFGCRCLRLFRLTSSWIGVGFLALGFRSQLFPFFCFLYFSVFFFLWFWSSPPSCTLFPLVLIKFSLRLAA